MTRRLVIPFILISTALIAASLISAADNTSNKPPAATRGTGADPVVFKGTGYQFSLTAVPGWSIEPTGQTDGQIAQIYAHHDSSGTAPAIINVMVDRKPEEGALDFQAAMRATLISIKKDNAGLVLSKDSSITVATGQEALVFLFSREGTGLREAWAALDADGAIIRIMYVARDEYGFREHLQEFKRMVAGYRDLAPKSATADKKKKETGPSKVK